MARADKVAAVAELAENFRSSDGAMLTEYRGLTVAQFADLEPREVLLAKLAGAMKASMARAAATFNALPTQLAQLAEALRVKREEAEGN